MDAPLIYYAIEKAIAEKLFCRIEMSSGDDFHCFITNFDGGFIMTKTMNTVGNNEDNVDEIFIDRLTSIEPIMTIDLDVLHHLPETMAKSFVYYRDNILTKPKQEKNTKTTAPKKSKKENAPEEETNGKTP